MRNAKLGGRSACGSFDPLGDRRTRRGERQVLISNVAIAIAFLFISAVVFGLVG